MQSLTELSRLALHCSVVPEETTKPCALFWLSRQFPHARREKPSLIATRSSSSECIGG